MNIEKSENTSLHIPVNVNFLKMGLAAYHMLGKSSSEYNLSGNIKINVPKIGEKSFPFSMIGDALLNR